jgi:hypothetical protein
MAIKHIQGLSDFDPDMKLANGDYLFEIKHAEFDVFQRSGRECLVIEGEFVDGPEQPTGIEVPGRKQTFKLGLPIPGDKDVTKNMMGGRIKKLNEACGGIGDELDTAVLEGKIIGVRMKLNEKSGYVEADRFFSSDNVSSGSASGSGSIY